MATGLFAFCGIAEPGAFFQSLSSLQVPLKGVCALDDHHAYRAAHLPLLCAKARRCGAQALVTTEKDLVKLAPLVHTLELPLYCLRMQVGLDVAFDALTLAAINHLVPYASSGLLKLSNLTGTRRGNPEEKTGGPSQVHATNHIRSVKEVTL